MDTNPSIAQTNTRKNVHDWMKLLHIKTQRVTKQRTVVGKSRVMSGKDCPARMSRQRARNTHTQNAYARTPCTRHRLKTSQYSDI